MRKSAIAGAAVVVMVAACSAGGREGVANAPAAVTAKSAAKAEADAEANADAKVDASANADADADAGAGASAEADARVVISVGKGTRVLMFGDSMVWSGLGWTLEKLVVARGGSFSFATKPLATTVMWAEGQELAKVIARTRPDVVIVALPANELFIPNPSARVRDIRKIVDVIGNRPCVWIGPAPWRPQKGMLDVVRENAAPCRFYDSTDLPIERQADGIHPTLAGGRAWADAVWRDVF